MTAMLSDAQRGVFVAPDRVTLGAFLLDEWLPARKAGLRPSTTAAYEQAIRNYVLPTLGGARLQNVDASMLNKLYGQLLSEGRRETRRGLGPGLAPKTVRNVHGMLTRAFRDAVRWGRVQRNPCDTVDPPRGQPPEMRAWTAEELRQFTSSVADPPLGGRVDAYRDDRDAPRRSPRLAMVRRRPRGAARSRSVRRASATARRSTTSTPKTARGNRTISVGPATVSAFRAWKRTQAADRLLMGAGWQDTAGLVVTVADGSAPNPEAFSNLFPDAHEASRSASDPPARPEAQLRHRSARRRRPGEGAVAADRSRRRRRHADDLRPCAAWRRRGGRAPRRRAARWLVTNL